jgi:hypothetical protein
MRSPPPRETASTTLSTAPGLAATRPPLPRTQEAPPTVPPERDGPPQHLLRKAPQ